MLSCLNAMPGASETDIALKLLQANERPMHYKELVEQVLSCKGIPSDSVQIAAVLTQINLDSRFVYVGKGEWSLKAWVPARGSRRLPTITLMNKALAYDDDKGTDLDKEQDLDEMDADLDDDAMLEEIHREDEDTDDENWDG